MPSFVERRFDKVIKMIDDMVALLKQEQLDDDHSKEHCQGQCGSADGKKKELTTDAKESAAILADEIKELRESIKALDKIVAEAAADRKDGNSDFETL